MSPTLLIQDGFRFSFYLSDLKEPPHVHVHGSSGFAKVWLQPVKVEYAKGLTQAERQRILKVVRHHRSAFLKAWAAYSRKEGPELDR